MSDEKHGASRSSPLRDHMNYLAGMKRAAAAQLLPPKRKAELINDRIMELMDQRADILGISKLSKSTKEQIALAMDGSPLLTKDDFDSEMGAEILRTREKVLTTMAQCKADFDKAAERAEMENGLRWRTWGFGSGLAVSSQ
ncbi:MAG: hypothetical protein Q9208_006583 [Pyrenodesmia sp. 3 TL-2023]